MIAPFENLSASLSEHLNTSIQKIVPVGGGDINEAFKASDNQGEHFFIKSHPNPPPGFFQQEAYGLSLLAQANCVAVPKVISLVDRAELKCLILEWITPGRATARTPVDFGERLAQLHQTHGSTFGLDHDNYIGTLPQPNDHQVTWAQFYGEQRLRPQLRLADERRLLPSSLKANADALLMRLDELVGPAEPPTLIHGDLWGGNRLIDHNGGSWLIDPAAYYGHREVDLAMMRLFGGFDPRTFEVYDAVYPLSEGWHERIELYQLYPMLVHLNLFGSTYLNSVKRIIDRYR